MILLNLMNKDRLPYKQGASTAKNPQQAFLANSLRAKGPDDRFHLNERQLMTQSYAFFWTIKKNMEFRFFHFSAIIILFFR